MTVFGVKHAAGRLFWELYFYDPRHGGPRVSLQTAAEAIGYARFQ